MNPAKIKPLLDRLTSHLKHADARDMCKGAHVTSSDWCPSWNQSRNASKEHMIVCVCGNSNDMFTVISVHPWTPKTCGWCVCLCVYQGEVWHQTSVQMSKTQMHLSFTLIILVFRGIPVLPLAVSSPWFSGAHGPQSPLETDTSLAALPSSSSQGWVGFPPPLGDETPQFSATNSAMSPV